MEKSLEKIDCFILAAGMSKRMGKDNKLLKKIPMGRFAYTNEIAELVFHLGTNENKFITGQQIFIDGGFSII